jgi:lipopolysaccharide export system ATP-binding protein
MATLQTQNLVKRFKKRAVVDQVSITLEQGKIVGLLGPNGAGKTTTFHCIVGLIKPDSGKILFSERNITQLPMYNRARLGISYLSQERSVFHRLTVEENILAVLETMKLKKAERLERCEKLMAEMDIAHLAKNKAYTLSGGESRRVEIARALATSPRFLLLDEPFSGIDPITVSIIQQIVLSLKQKDIGILITDHNVRDTFPIIDWAYIIYDGKMLIEGKPTEIITDMVAREKFLGKSFAL